MPVKLTGQKWTVMAAQSASPPRRCYRRRLATNSHANPLWGEVELMWKRKLIKAVLTMIFTVLMAVLLTIKAC